MIIIDTQVVDNILPKTYINELLNVINYDFVWDWQERTTYESSISDQIDNGIWDKQMSSMVYKDGKVHSQKYGFFLPILYILEEKFNINIKTLIRIKINKTFTIPEDQYVSPWHHDGYGDIDTVKTILIYLDESDGGTLISNIKTDGVSSTSELIKNIDDEVEYIEYKPNRAVLFDSSRFHYGELPKKHKCRTVLNIVFV